MSKYVVVEIKWPGTGVGVFDAGRLVSYRNAERKGYIIRLSQHKTLEEARAVAEAIAKFENKLLSVYL